MNVPGSLIVNSLLIISTKSSKLFILGFSLFLFVRDMISDISSSSFDGCCSIGCSCFSSLGAATSAYGLSSSVCASLVCLTSLAPIFSAAFFTFSTSSVASTPCDYRNSAAWSTSGTAITISSCWDAD